MPYLGTCFLQKSLSGLRPFCVKPGKSGKVEDRAHFYPPRATLHVPSIGTFRSVELPTRKTLKVGRLERDMGDLSKICGSWPALLGRSILASAEHQLSLVGTVGANRRRTPHVPRLIMRPWLRIANCNAMQCNAMQHFQLIRYTRPNLRQRPTPVPSRSCSPLCVAPAFEPTRFWHLAFCSVVAASPPGGRFPRDAMLDDGIGQGSGNLDKHLSMQAHWGGCLRHSG